MSDTVSVRESDAPYDLFISYHRRDLLADVGRRKIDLLAMFKRELETHRRPSSLPGPSRFRVCTDVDDFELGETFDKVMGDRIRCSRKFLLICSANAASSPYVQQELALFKRLKPGENPLVAIFGQNVATAFPGLVSDQIVLVNLNQPDNTLKRQWHNTLRRESHKVVAWVWGMSPAAVFDRFEAHRRAIRRWIASTAATTFACVGALVVALAGSFGFHRYKELPAPANLVAPAGTGYARDGSTPVVFRDRIAYQWATNADPSLPIGIKLPVDALYAVQDRPGEVLLADVKEVAHFDMDRGLLSPSITLAGEVAGIATFDGESAIATKDGALVYLTASGEVKPAPRPVSETGRRFPSFRETGPFEYGGRLVMNETYLASATDTGRLGIVNRKTGMFVLSAEPQFPLAQPVIHKTDPVLYETENTRPISALALLENGDLLFAEGTGLRSVDLQTGRITFLAHCPIELVRQILPLPASLKIVALTSSTLEVLEFDRSDRSKLDCISRTTLAPKFSPRATLSATGRNLLIAYFDGPPEIWRPSFQLFGWQLPLPSWLW
ncbi:toll/interleukin-1 receptor domain-containing protein (plasmid) [Rhizobium leguminosarum]